MTNYDKKRQKLQKRARKCVPTESERERIYRQGFFDGQAQVIDGMTEAGILPRLDFKTVPVTQEEFKKDYPNEPRTNDN
jgi:hypothetical protein